MPERRKIEMLVTLPLNEALSEEISQVSERVSLTVLPVSQAVDIPDEVWEKTEALYTMHVLPTPEQAPHLRWIQSYLAGVDKITNQPIAKKENLRLTSMSGANASQVAEHVLTMMLALGHNVPGFLNLQAKSQWMQDKGHHYIPLELRGSTVGIVGYGSIGRQIARLVHTFGADVLATKRDLMHPADEGFTPPEMGDPDGDLFTRLYPPEALRSMVSECDFVVVTVPLTEQTKGMFGKPQFEAMKESAFLVDVSRGGVVDETALVAALQAGQLAGAALDVFTQEPLGEDHPLWSQPNVIITPHVAGFSPAYNQRANQLLVENVRRYLADEPLFNEVDLNKEY